MTPKHTPGPWRWEVNKKSKNVQLCGGRPMYDLIIMDFVRYGMQSAAPRFRTMKDDELSIMEHCDQYSEPVPGREHHASWFQTINHPDAKLIEAAPDLLQALHAIYQNLSDIPANERTIYDDQNLQLAARAIQKATL